MGTIAVLHRLTPEVSINAQVTWVRGIVPALVRALMNRLAQLRSREIRQRVGGYAGTRIRQFGLIRSLAPGPT